MPANSSHGLSGTGVAALPKLKSMWTKGKAENGDETLLTSRAPSPDMSKVTVSFVARSRKASVPVMVKGVLNVDPGRAARSVNTADMGAGSWTKVIRNPNGSPPACDSEPYWTPLTSPIPPGPPAFMKRCVVPVVTKDTGRNIALLPVICVLSPVTLANGSVAG